MKTLTAELVETGEKRDARGRRVMRAEVREALLAACGAKTNGTTGYGADGPNAQRRPPGAGALLLRVFLHEGRPHRLVFLVRDFLVDVQLIEFFQFIDEDSGAALGRGHRRYDRRVGLQNNADGFRREVVLRTADRVDAPTNKAARDDVPKNSAADIASHSNAFVLVAGFFDRHQMVRLPFGLNRHRCLA